MSDAQVPSDELFPQTWFKIHRYYDKIEPKRVHKITTCFVTVDGYSKGNTVRESIEDYFRTWEQARGSLRARKQREVEYAQVRLQQAETQLAAINAMEPPK